MILNAPNNRHSTGWTRRVFAAVCLLAASPVTQAAPLRISQGNNWLPWWLLLLAIFWLGWLLWKAVRDRNRQQRMLSAEIHEHEERLNLALWGSGDELWDWNIKDNTLRRLGAEYLLGRGSRSQLAGDELQTKTIHPDDIPRVKKLLDEHIAGKTSLYESEHRIRNAAGDWIWVRARGKVVERDSTGAAVRISGTARDITTVRQAEDDRRVAFEVLRSMGEAVAVVDIDYHFTAVNPAFSRITGYTQDDVLGKSSSLLNSSQHSAEFYRRVRDMLNHSGQWSGEMWQRRKDSEEFLGWINVSEVRDGNNVRSHFVFVVTDITEKKRAEQELRYLASYDTLTGLPNRALLSERLGRAITKARRQDARVAVLFLDLDRFKDINDSLGHAAGDRLLKAVATRLQAAVGNRGTVARLGGDEFTVVIEAAEDMQVVEHMAREILTAFSMPLEIGDRHDVNITPSLGISLYPDHALVPTELLKFADTAMYQAKSAGRNTYQIYNETMDARSRERATILAALRKAIDRDEFRLLFQPRLTLANGHITGVEALLRWNSAELGEVPTSVFIPLAEENGLILQIGDWVLNEACQTLKRWRTHGLTELSMAINIAVLQLLRNNLPESLHQLLIDTGVPGDRIELEVTESMVMQNAEQTTAVLTKLRDMGISLAIDDFGTGYSSLVYLKRLPIDTLKIDKAFVNDLTHDADDKAIVTTIISMGHTLGLNVVAEGVESLDQLAFLQQQGCDEIQGYWVSPPVDSQRCLAFIRGWQPETITRLTKPVDLTQT